MSGILEDEQAETDYSSIENDILPLDEETTIKDRPPKKDPAKKSSQEKISKDKAKKDKKINKKPEKHIKKPEKQGRPTKKPDAAKKDKTKKDEENKPKLKPGDKKKVRPVTSKVPHVSRPKIKSPPAKRKPREIRDVDSCGESVASLKRPRPNSCERCWKYVKVVFYFIIFINFELTASVSD